MRNIDEKKLIQDLHNPATKRHAFELMVGTYSQRLYWQIRRMVTFHDDADDVLQNTFLKAWSNIDKFRGDSKLSTWLFKIAYNESVTYLSQQPDNISLDVSPNEENEEADNGIASRLESDNYFDGDKAELLLQQAIAILPAKQKAVFNMKYYEDMKYEEIAEITGTSIGALKASYHLAAKKIEDYVKSKL